MRRIVEAGYDAMAENYLKSKNPNDAATISSLEELAKVLPEGASVLDLGCGAGVPATRWLSERFDVTGVDISAGQLQIARKNVPKAKFIKCDMGAFEAEPESLDAVVSLLSIIHVPRDEQPGLFRSIHRWLKPGGHFFGILSVGEWEGYEPDWQGWGAGMWWSHHDAQRNLAMLRESGFDIVRSQEKTDEGVGSGNETWLHVLARKRLGRDRRSAGGYQAEQNIIS